MAIEKVTISLPSEIANILREEVPKRKRSKFITEAIAKELKRLKENVLKKAYKEAYKEIEIENQEFEGVIGNGIP